MIRWVFYCVINIFVYDVTEVMFLKKIIIVSLLVVSMLVGCTQKEETKPNISGTVTYIDKANNVIEVIHGMKKTTTIDNLDNETQFGTYHIKINKNTKGLKINELNVMDEVNVWFDGEVKEINDGNGETKTMVKKSVVAKKIEKL